MKNRQENDWWTITLGDPISWIVLAALLLHVDQIISFSSVTDMIS